MGLCSDSTPLSDDPREVLRRLLAPHGIEPGEDPDETRARIAPLPRDERRRAEELLHRWEER